VRFELLGPLRVVEGDSDVTPARPKQRALLSLLLLRRDEVVPGAQLIEALWGEEPPGTAQTALHGHISSLRKLLGADAIRTRPPGYLLHVAPGELDVARFESLIAAALTRDDPVDRSARLRDALSLWRGEPLADLHGEAFAEREIARLNELRLAALEDRIDADLALGRHRELVAELEPLVTEHVFRERLRGQLMLALYRCGRQADALHAFQAGRRTLVEQLGIEPGPALQQLELHILRHDPSLDVPLGGAQPAARTPTQRQPPVGYASSGDVSIAHQIAGERPLAWEPIRYAHSGDVSIAYTVGGDGPVDLLFIGGFVSHLEIQVELPLAQRFFDRLGSFARVVLFDKRGMGLSDRDVGAFTVEDVVDDALAVLDAVGMERVAVFGVSEGGSAATMLAAARPERVSAMVQYGTYARVSQAPDYPEGVRPDVLHRFVSWMVEEWGNPVSLDLWAPSLAGDPEARAWWARWLRSGASPGAVRTIGLMYEALDVRPLLSSVSVPTLVLYRSGDRLFRPPLPHAVAVGIPGARELELMGDDHLFIAGDQDAMLDQVEEFVTGRPPAAAPDRMLATVVFTDIVRSTERAAELGDRRWRELLGQHNRLVERELARYRGRFVKSIGDGVLATFDGPGRAVRFALAIREGAQTMGLELRAGVHTGECEVLANDVAGMAVHLAARVQAAAGPGDVLTSGTVKDLVVGSGLEFEDRGRHVLKGVPGEWSLYAAAGDAERRRPPVAAPAGGRHH
jgi:DNA-binding SARP family transcriptional activator/class 3 adenylate cyclase